MEDKLPIRYDSTNGHVFTLQLRDKEVNLKRNEDGSYIFTSSYVANGQYVRPMLKWKVLKIDTQV
jgi:hypothetical protein